MEVSFKEEIASLRLGEGETFRGERAPVSHLMDVLLQSEELLQELGMHLQTCTGEAAAAAMPGASVAHPMRGAVTCNVEGVGSRRQLASRAGLVRTLSCLPPHAGADNECWAPAREQGEHDR